MLGDVGYYCYLQGRMDEAEKCLRQALAERPRDPVILNNLAILVGEQGRYQESLALFRQSGKEAEAYASLGFVLLQRGETERAKEAYARALTLDPNFRPAAEAMVQLADYGKRSPTRYPQSPAAPAHASPRWHARISCRFLPRRFLHSRHNPRQPRSERRFRVRGRPMPVPSTRPR